MVEVVDSIGVFIVVARVRRFNGVEVGEIGWVRGMEALKSLQTSVAWHWQGPNFVE
jgi:hypothetical protein